MYGKMKIEQLYTGCLAEAAYYIESEGEAAIIDPLRETGPYLQMAAQAGATIKYIFETHFHADFVSGHVDLARETGATIVYGPNARTGYDAHIAVDGEEFRLGNIRIRTLHTPGHTLESTTWLLIDENGEEKAIFTGDTLFIGDVGRPDLAVKSDLSQRDLAGLLYDSLHQKIMTLPDETIVYPAHGAGSACGKNMSKETFDTLGHQKEVNYALRAPDKESFIKEVTEGILPPPQYFPKNAVLNMQGYESIDSVMDRGAQALSVAAFEAAAEGGALILDVRIPDQFRDGHIPNALNIGLNGQFAVWVGTLIADLKQPLILVAPEDKVQEAVMRLARVGYDHVQGYLQGGMAAWQTAGKQVETVDQVTAAELADLLKQGPLQVLDVRKPGEYTSEHMEAAQTFPLDYFLDHLDDLDKDAQWYVHCQGGYRSMIAVSMMRRAGYKHLVDVAGGFNAIAKADIPKTAYICPSTIK
jgi:glyoxylase-like metal-dependent hydrolase (beta-lactamase superfamily II)/rhodanese-related sulfurtransferase